LIKERLRGLLFGEPAAPDVRAVRTPDALVTPIPPHRAEVTRGSRGLEQFFLALKERRGGNILDLGESSQANISAITGLGFRLSSENFLHSLDAFYRNRSSQEGRSDAHLREEFLSQTLQYPAAHFDGALLWNCLEYLTPELLESLMPRLTEILRPRAVVFALFHGDCAKGQSEHFAFRIQDTRTLMLVPRRNRTVLLQFNNRSLERLFSEYHSVKFFLTRVAYRELLLQR